MFAMLYPFLLSTPVPVIIGREGGGILNQWEYFNQRANELERYNYKTPGVNVADPDGSVRKRRREIDEAQLKSADDVRKMLEIMQKNQEEQARETKKAQSFSRWSLVVGVLTLAATIIFGILQVTH
jgi:hypothetical protein